jgi:hypothetical protein
MSSDTVRETRTQFESAAGEILEELAGRGVRVLSDQLDETSGKIRAMQEATAASVSELLKRQAADALQAFEQSMEQLARLSVERWRAKFEGGLNALTKSLNEQFRPEAQ